MSETGTRGERNEKVASAWGDFSRRREDAEAMRLVGWAEHPLVARRLNLRASGNENTYWVDWALGALPGVRRGRGLSLGCGSGYIERRIIDLGLASFMEGFDVSEEAVRLASLKAGERPIEYRVLDLNRGELPPERYDFAVSAAALHHVTNLEHCLAQVHRSLKKGGFLVFNEFVGPDRFQWPEERLELVNRIYRLLPDRYRHNFITGLSHPRIERKPLAHMIEADPSEAVRSSELLDVTGVFFDTVSLRKTGGSLLHPLLEGIIGNFSEDGPLDVMLLRGLMALEDQLMRGGHLGSDFVFYTGRKKKPSLPIEEMLKTGGRKMDIITRQEEEILALNRRLEDANVRNSELVRALEIRVEEIRKLRERSERLAAENLALKSEGPLKTLRFLRSKLRR